MTPARLVSAEPGRTPSQPTVRAWWQLFEQRAGEYPSRIALSVGDSSWTFAELADQAERMAARLRLSGLRDGEIVACLMPRTLAGIVAPLAVGMAGGVYLPLDLESPAERIETLLADSGAALVLSGTGLERRSAEPRRIPPLDGDRPAYLMYTSGSSGPAKAVVVGDRGLLNLYRELSTRYFGLARPEPEDRRTPAQVVHGAPFAFDASWNPLLWMVGGHHLHLLPENVRTDPDLYLEAVHRHRMDVVEAVPSMASALIDAGLLADGTRPRLLLMGGEAIGPGLWTKLRQIDDLIAVNLYGPTECTVFATAARIADSPEPVIGGPITGARAIVVNEQAGRVAPGESGELLIAGACVAHGYLDRPDLTAERFVRLPGDPDRWYRTGDRCRLLAGGELEFQGRLDDQVKIRGVRVEPAETEYVLGRLPGVRGAMVRAEGEGLRRHLVGYVVPATPAGPGTAELLAELSNQLPEAQVPAELVLVQALPLGPNGKVDRSASIAPAEPEQRSTAPTGPRSVTEKLVAEAWSDVLGIADPDVHTDFHEVGGHSLLAAQLALRLRAEGLDCGLPEVLAHPTIAALAAALAPAESPERNQE